MLKRPDVKVNVDRCLEVADFIESLPTENGKMDAIQLLFHGNGYACDEPYRKPTAFSMRAASVKMSECGTVGCIAGYIGFLTEMNQQSFSTHRAGEYLGIDKEQSAALFMPDHWMMSDYTSHDAAKVLRHLAITGEVDWSIVGKEGQIPGLPTLDEMLEEIPADKPGTQADLIYSYTNGHLIPDPHRPWELIPKRYRQSWGVKK